MAATSPICEFGLPAPPFSLKGTDGRVHALADLAGPKGTVIVFMCNHCPYVKAIVDKLAAETEALRAIGVSLIGINANDSSVYKDDSFESMQRWAAEKKFPFPYLHDETQAVAKAYGAVCTPDFFGYDADLGLQYRGRLDASMKSSAVGARRDLFLAMQQVVETGRGPTDQTPAIGCSIKWKAEHA